MIWCTCVLIDFWYFFRLAAVSEGFNPEFLLTLSKGHADGECLRRGESGVSTELSKADTVNQEFQPN